MLRVTKKDVALVAFAGGLLAFELTSLGMVAPAMVRTLAGATGLQAAEIRAAGARTGTAATPGMRTRELTLQTHACRIQLRTRAAVRRAVPMPAPSDASAL